MLRGMLTYLWVMYKSTSFRARGKLSRCCVPKALNNSLKREGFQVIQNIVSSILSLGNS